MKTTWKFLLMAAVVLGLGMSVTSCKDDDDDEKSEEQKQQEAQQQADVFWDVVGQLTSMDNYTTDYRNKTFEPTIGQPSDDNPTVRIVATNDLETAAERFANLVGLEMDNGFSAETPSYSWSNDAVGTLAYRKTTDGSSLATVDVNIRQLPRLQKIVYMTPAQMGTNKSFPGTAYYRFGDVVSHTYTYTNRFDKEKTQVDYWICVRPAFGPEGKEDSHWMCVSSLTENNLWFYTSSENIDYSLPTGLGTNKEHMQNLAELLYAMLNPAQWDQNVRDNKKLKMFHDFNHSKIDMNSQYFFKRVNEAWDEDKFDGKTLWLTVFGQTGNTIRQQMEKDGLYLLYKGYSWWTWSSWKATLYQAHYGVNNTAATKKNMHDVTYNEVEKDMHGINYMEFSKCNDTQPYFYNDKFFGNAIPRYTVRYASGKDLFGKQPDVYGSLESEDRGLKDVYVYNLRYKVQWGPQENPETLTTEPEKILDPAKGPFMLGDVIKDGYDDSRWICIAGHSTMPGYFDQNKRSLFISLDNIKQDPDGNTASNVMNLQDAMFVGYLIMYNMSDLFKDAAGLGDAFFQNAKEFAGFDMDYYKFRRDSTYTLLDKDGNIYRENGKQFDSFSQPFFLNIAYNDGTTDRQPLLRAIYDLTHAGNYRNTDPVDKDMYFRYYTKYQVNPTESTHLAWIAPWPMSDTRMYLQDIADQGLVNRYAAQDKWVTLPLFNQTKQQNPRTTADNRANSITNYLWVDGARTSDATGMFNEPILFARAMWVDDDGNIKGETGANHDLLMLKKVSNREQYFKGMNQMLWIMGYFLEGTELYKNQFFLNNELYMMPGPDSDYWK